MFAGGGIASCVTLTYLCEIFWNRVCSAACASSSPLFFCFLPFIRTGARKDPCSP